MRSPGSIVRLQPRQQHAGRHSRRSARRAPAAGCGSFAGSREAELEARRRHVRRRDALHALQRLDAALRLARLGGLGAEALDEGLHVADLALLALAYIAPCSRQLHRGALRLEVRVVAAVARRPCRCSMLTMRSQTRSRNSRSCAISSSVPRILAQPGLEPQDGVEVEVVGGLVQQQQVRAAHQRARHVEAHAPAAGEIAHRPRLVGRCKAQAMHQLRGARARVVAADAGESACSRSPGACRRRAPRPAAMRPSTCAQLGIAVEHELDRRLVGGVELLRHVRHLQVARASRSDRHRAASRRAPAPAGWTCRCRSRR